VTLSLFETIQRIVRQEVMRVRTAELATVQAQHSHSSDSDKDNYACTVQLRNSEIVLKQVPVATPRIGSVSIPAVGDLVLVQFIDGDINAPVIVGSLYNDQDRPPANQDGQSILHLPLGAADGDAVRIELTSGDQRKVVIKLGDALTVNVADDDPVIEIEVDGGKAKVVIERDGAISFESQGKVQVKGSEITIEAQGQLTLKGATVDIN
jgi:uncharacterized protein involved in type VI secretion and phage assembly